MIKKRKHALESISLDFGWDPANEDVSEYENSQSWLDLREFFCAVLSCKNLKDLCLRMPDLFLPMTALLAAVEQLGCSTSKPVELSCLALITSGLVSRKCKRDAGPLLPLVQYFKDCHSIETIRLNLPSRFWEQTEGLNAFSTMMMNNQQLRDAFFSFGEVVNY